MVGRLLHNLAWELDHYWKDGAILAKPETEDTALIRIDQFDRSLYITVRGPTAGFELLQMVENIDTIVDNLRAEVNHESYLHLA